MKCTHLKNIYFAIHSGFISRKGLLCCAWWSPIPAQQGQAQPRRGSQAGLPTHPSWAELLHDILLLLPGAGCPPVGGETMPPGQTVSSCYRNSKHTVCPRCFPKWERSPESTFRCLGFWSVPSCTGGNPSRCVGWEAEGPWSRQRGHHWSVASSHWWNQLSYHSYHSYHTLVVSPHALLGAMAPKEAGCDQLIGVVPKSTFLYWEV